MVPVQWNRRRRRYRSNQGPLEAVVGGVQKFIDVEFWTSTALPAVGGFLGTKFVGSAIAGFVGEQVLGVAPTDAAFPWVRIGSEVVGVSALCWAAKQFLPKEAEEALFLGGVVSIAHGVLKMALGGTDIGRAIGLDGLGLGEDLAARMRRAVSQRVAAELSGSGMNEYLNQTALQRQMGPGVSGVGTFVTDTELRRQPSYAALPTGDVRQHDVLFQETGI